MNTAARQARGFADIISLSKEAPKITWRNILITNRSRLRAALILKHGSLTQACTNLGVGFAPLSDVLHSRRHNRNVVEAIQADVGLSDDQVLDFWPLLKRWPREEREAV